MRVKGKKSVAFMSDEIFWMIFIIALGVTLVATSSLANYFVAKSVEIPKDAEEDSLIPRFYDSKQCFAYEDDAGRVHSRTIDSKKFTQENMNNCYPKSKVRYTFKLELVPNFDTKSIQTFNWEDSFTAREKTENIFVFHKEKKHGAKLKIKINDVQ